MSWKASAFVKEITRNITQSEKLVLLVLADYHHTKHQAAWPSVSVLAEECLLTERGLYKILARLKRKGFLLIQGERGRRNEYVILGLDTPEQSSPLPLNEPLNRRLVTPERTPEPRGIAIRKEPVLEPVIQPVTSISAKKFSPPRLEEVKFYARQLNAKSDPEAFFDHFVANGWRTNSGPMKDWQAAFRNWERNNYKFSGGGNANGRRETKAEAIARANKESLERFKQQRDRGDREAVSSDASGDGLEDLEQGDWTLQG